MKKFYLITFTLLLTASCQKNDDIPEIRLPETDPEKEIYKIPVVVHVLHNGEAIGVGPNISKERIESQIEILNQDYRRKYGTRGYNDHPNGGDAGIEFILAKFTPDGKPTDGIVRVNQDEVENPYEGSNFDYMAGYSYWDPASYLNIWTIATHNDYVDSFLGVATGPETDLPGAHLLTPGEPHQAEGIIMGYHHFGVSDINSKYNLGRTLTHEIGHYLGLLHTWGAKDCTYNDYCDDTPAVDTYVSGSTPFIGCGGELVMIGNYMNWSDDEVMNIFTNDQIYRMRYVLQNSPGRKSLLTSIGLGGFTQ